MSMSEALEKKFKERSWELKEHKNLPHFEDEQLLGLHVIVNKLSRIEASLHTINDHLGKIEAQ